MEKQTLPRESSFELLRILAQVFIVYYHILLNVVFPETGDPLYRALWLPLHIGVPLFVLVSGYFGIKPSVRGVVRLTGTVFAIHIPLSICNLQMGGVNGLLDWAAAGLFISATPYWFIRTYICLYLFAPVINRFLRDIGPKERIALLCVLACISLYMGTIGFDASLADGKNLATFLFFYAMGDTLHAYRHRWLPYRRWYGLCWLGLNVGLVALFTRFTSRLGMAIFYRVWFSYCSFGLLFNALLFFMWIGGMRFRSRQVNRIARSSLLIYLLHGAPFVANHLIAPFVLQYICPIADRWLLLGAILLFTLVVVTLCIIIDRLLGPIWKCLDRLGNRLQQRWDRLHCTYFTR